MTSIYSKDNPLISGAANRCNCCAVVSARHLIVKQVIPEALDRLMRASSSQETYLLRMSLRIICRQITKDSRAKSSPRVLHILLHIIALYIPPPLNRRYVIISRKLSIGERGISCSLPPPVPYLSHLTDETRYRLDCATPAAAVLRIRSSIDTRGNFHMVASPSAPSLPLPAYN
jgi:hypothetical protein